MTRADGQINIIHDQPRRSQSSKNQAKSVGLVQSRLSSDRNTL